MKVEITGEKELQAAFKQLIDNVDGGELAMVGANVVYDISQTKVPVDSGDLQRSGEVYPSGDEAIVRYTEEYAAYVEFGTSRMAAQSYLRWAIDQTSRIMTEVTNKLKSQIRIGA